MTRVIFDTFHTNMVILADFVKALRTVSEIAMYGWGGLA